MSVRQPPVLFGTPTTSPKKPVSTRTKNRRSANGRARSTVPVSRWAKQSANSASLPPLSYSVGPFVLVLPDYDVRVFLHRGSDADTVEMTEIEGITWDDSSAVMTGTINFREPDWMNSLGVKEGHEFSLDCSSDGGYSWTPVWRMRLDAPNRDIMQRATTANLVNDLNRLQQSNDDFKFVKDKAHPRGWRIDQVIQFICDAYGIPVASLPVMSAYITNWHLIDQHPLDVIHSALLREKTVTGLKYAVSLDPEKRLHVTAYQRPRNLLEVGPLLVAATYTAQHDPRFATEVTVRSDLPTKLVKDLKGHKKVKHDKVAVKVVSPTGTAVYGTIHRNVYSPDASTIEKAQAEGALFLHEIAKPIRTYTVTMPGMPLVQRLDAMRVSVPERGTSQIVYVQDAKHSWSGSSGYQTETVLAFEDPFADDKAAAILTKLTDAAVASGRVTPTGASKTKKLPPNGTVRLPKGATGTKAAPHGILFGTGVSSKPTKTAKR